MFVIFCTCDADALGSVMKGQKELAELANLSLKYFDILTIWDEVLLFDNS